MPAVQTQLPIPRIAAEDFEHIPDTKSYVALSKLMNSEDNVIAGIPGYRMVQIAQNLGLHLTSSEEWGKSRKYFQDNSDRKFGERTGKDIETDYISRHIEQTGSFLSFREGGEFPEDTKALLNEAGFDGGIALIDFPYVLEEDGKKFIFIKSPRMMIRDVTEINGKPFPKEEGNVRGYDWDTGLITGVGPNPDFQSAYYWVVPKGTRMVLRGHWGRPLHEGRRFNVNAHWGPSNSGGGVSARLSSGNEPSEFLDITKLALAQQELSCSLEAICNKYGVDTEKLVQGLKK